MSARDAHVFAPPDTSHVLWHRSLLHDQNISTCHGQTGHAAEACATVQL